MSTERKFQGVWIPASIWLDRSLSITEKVMLVEINSLEQPDRGCYAGNDYFAGFFDLSKSRVSEIISNLAAKGLIRVVLIREGKQIVGRQIWLTKNGRQLTNGTPPSSENTHTPSSENKETPFGKGGDPSSEKAKESNTESNNTKSNKTKPFSLPDWIQKDSWDGFVEMRKTIKKPLTERAMVLTVLALAKMRVEGEDVNAVLDQSAMNSWQGVFSAKNPDSRNPKRPEKFDPFSFVNRNAIKPGEPNEKLIN